MPPDLLLAYQYQKLPKSAGTRLERVAQAAATEKTTTAQRNYAIASLLALLAIVGTAMVLLPRRQHT